MLGSGTVDSTHQHPTENPAEWGQYHYTTPLSTVRREQESRTSLFEKKREKEEREREREKTHEIKLLIISHDSSHSHPTPQTTQATDHRHPPSSSSLITHIKTNSQYLAAIFCIQSHANDIVSLFIIFIQKTLLLYSPCNIRNFLIHNEQK
jgi:hypothetical protein